MSYKYNIYIYLINLVVDHWVTDHLDDLGDFYILVKWTTLTPDRLTQVLATSTRAFDKIQLLGRVTKLFPIHGLLWAELQAERTRNYCQMVKIGENGSELLWKVLFWWVIRCILILYMSGGKLKKVSEWKTVNLEYRGVRRYVSGKRFGFL